MVVGKARTTEKDLPPLNQKPEAYQDGSMGVHVPFDVPCYVRVFQIHEKTDDDGGSMHSEAIKANLVQMDFWTFGGVKVIGRIDGYGKDATLKVYLQDSDGTSMVAEYTKGEE